MKSNHTTSEVFRRLQEDPENRNCFDCNNLDVSYASVNLGIMLCENCASQHSSLGINISHVKSLKEKWTTHHLKLMAAGGNTSLKTFFAMYSIPLNDPNKFITVACEYYREMLKMMADGNRIMMLTPTEDEGLMLMEEFRPPDPPIDPPKENKPETDPNTIEKFRKSKTFSAFLGVTSGAFDFISQGVKWGAEKGIESLEWSAQQGKQLIRKMSNHESLIEEAKEVYSKLQLNLNFARIKEETLKMLQEIEDKSSSF